MQRSNLALLADMREFAQKALDIVSALTPEQFSQDEILQLAVTRLLQNAGEAAYKTEREFRALHPEIPWRGIIDFRHRLVHHYDDLDYDFIWAVATQDTAQLIELIDAVLSA